MFAGPVTYKIRIQNALEGGKQYDMISLAKHARNWKAADKWVGPVLQTLRRLY